MVAARGPGKTSAEDRGEVSVLLSTPLPWCVLQLAGMWSSRKAAEPTTCPDKRLRVQIQTPSGPVYASPFGEPVSICNEHFEGTIFFAHRPPKGSATPLSHPRRLDGKGSPGLLWEVQLQGRLKTKPRGPLLLQAELRDKPMKMGPIMRGVANVVLRFLQYHASLRNLTLNYSFGQQKDGIWENPSLSISPHISDRLFVADRPHALPLGDDNLDNGTWKEVDGRWVAVDRSALSLDSSCYMTWGFSTRYVDWFAWQIANVPGVGSIDLKSFWGDQPCWMGLIDEGQQGERRWLLESCLKMVDSAEEDTADGDAASDQDLAALSEISSLSSSPFAATHLTPKGKSCKVSL